MSPSSQPADMRAIAKFRRAWRFLVQTARLIVGIPDYDLYLAHLQRLHPDRAPMTREEFFSERLLARYGRNANRCC